MKLTKEQIQHIDQHLKKAGIKYWDVRLEMVDHLASDIFENAKTNDFELELHNALQRANWDKNLHEVHTQSWKNTNKLYRRLYFKAMISVFKSFDKAFIFFISFGSYFFLAKNLNVDDFVSFSFFIFMTPVVLVLFLITKVLFLKLGRSVHLDYGVSYLIMNFLILQMFPQLLKDTADATQLVVWLIIMPIHFISTYAGYKVFKKAKHKTIITKSLLKP